MSKPKHKTREQWLTAAVEKMRRLLKEHDVDMPEKWQVSCGFPKSRSKAIGQCWSGSCTEDGTHHMFICPSLAKATRVLDVLLHEMIHAAVGTECGHKGKFRIIAKAVGLTGKMTATVCEEGSALHDKLVGIATTLGDYPHSALTKNPVAWRPPAGGWVKFQSVNEEGYILRVSPKSLNEHGVPKDPWGDDMEEA